MQPESRKGKKRTARAIPFTHAIIKSEHWWICTNRRSATNLMYWLIKLEFMPISAQGRASHTNWVSISTASWTMWWTFCQWSRFRNKLFATTINTLSIIFHLQYYEGIQDLVNEFNQIGNSSTKAPGKEVFLPMDKHPRPNKRK